MNRILATSFLLASSWPILRRFKRVCHHNEKTHPKGGISCITVVPWSGRWQGRVLEGIYCVAVEIFHGGPQRGHYPFRTLMFHGDLCVAYAPTARHIRIPFLSKCITSSSESWTKTTFVLFRCLSTSCGDASRYFRRVPTWNFFIPKVVAAQQWFAILSKRLYSVDRLLPRKTVTLLLSFDGRIRFVRDKSLNRRHKWTTARLETSSTTPQQLHRCRETLLCVRLRSLQLHSYVSDPISPDRRCYTRLIGWRFAWWGTTSSKCRLAAPRR